MKIALHTTAIIIAFVVGLVVGAAMTLVCVTSLLTGGGMQ